MSIFTLVGYRERLSKSGEYRFCDCYFTSPLTDGFGSETKNCTILVTTKTPAICLGESYYVVYNEKGYAQIISA